MNDVRIARLSAAALASAILLLAAGAARANPRPLPFTYQSETLPTGAVEVEQFVDMQPLRSRLADGSVVWVLPPEFTTEFEVGVTDRLELGLYVTMVPGFGSEAFAPPPSISDNGAKQRVRYRLADPGAWPLDVALYGEVSETSHEVELEGKIILQRRIGALRLITNLWAERELYLDGRREWVANPTLGATVELSPRYSVGFEGWMRWEHPDAGGPKEFNDGPHVFVGPAFLASFGRLWWSTGVYGRVTDFSRTTQAGDGKSAGDAYGHVWVRTIIGLAL
ncbi:MAG TPA: hypothetical protein VHJ20_23030 [Polyangia bacterium]|nr:hypothetical protein [Polyangia bacterium]